VIILSIKKTTLASGFYGIATDFIAEVFSLYTVFPVCQQGKMGQKEDVQDQTTFQVQ